MHVQRNLKGLLITLVATCQFSTRFDHFCTENLQLMSKVSCHTTPYLIHIETEVFCLSSP